MLGFTIFTIATQESIKRKKKSKIKNQRFLLFKRIKIKRIKISGDDY